jgi:hypothetical protein
VPPRGKPKSPSASAQTLIDRVIARRRGRGAPI